MGRTLTVAEAVAEPPVPLHVSVKVEVLVSDPVDALPEVARAPLQSPLAVQVSAALELQVNCVASPESTLLAAAEIVTVGAPATVTVTDSAVVPPAPLQLRLNTLLVVSAPVAVVPEVARLPDQAPEAAHVVAPVADQVSVELLPDATDVGLALNETTGAPGTVTVTVLLALPPAPLQVNV